jgi:hypothetical protein
MGISLATEYHSTNFFFRKNSYTKIMKGRKGEGGRGRVRKEG